MTPERLLTCPFCGGQASGPHTADYTYEEGDQYVYCLACCAESGCRKSGDEAIKHWNTRHLARQDAEAVCETCDGTKQKIIGETVDGYETYVECPDCDGLAGQRPSPSASEDAEQCRMHCAWKGGGPCLAEDCPRKQAERPARQDAKAEANDLWRKYQLGQVSCDHTQREVFVEVVSAALRSQPQPHSQPGDRCYGTGFRHYENPREAGGSKQCLGCADCKPSASQGEAVSEERREALRAGAASLVNDARKWDEHNGHPNGFAAHCRKHAATLSTWAESKT